MKIPFKAILKVLVGVDKALHFLIKIVGEAENVMEDIVNGN